MTEIKVKKILFVDDEPNLLRGMQRGFRGLRHEWQMLFAGSGAEALEILAQQPVDIVISDFRMPVMNGFELLSVVKENYPKVIRVILTGQPDMATYADTISICHYFLWKPVEIEMLQRLLERIRALDTILSDDKITSLLGGLATLPSLPTIYVQLTALLSDPENDSSAIVNIVSQDLSLTMEILKLVNSAFMGLAHEVSSLEKAVQYLGLNTLRSLVLANHVFSMANEDECREFALVNLWEHSFCVAKLAEELIPGHHEKHIVGYASFGGLLHDVGKLVFAHCLPQGYRQVLERMKMAGIGQSAAERQIFGTDHAAVGGYLAMLWGLPYAVVEAICLHDKVWPNGLVDSIGVASAVWHANRICNGNSEHSKEQLLSLARNPTLKYWLEMHTKERV